MERLRSRFWKIYEKEGFDPGLLGLLFNPYYLVRRRQRRTVRELAARLAGGRLLDVGCGGKPYRDLFAVDAYVGLDTESSGHDHARSRIDVFYDGRAMPFADETFDSVVSSDVFEHVFDLDALIAEINRVTRTGGHLLITLPFLWPEHEAPFDFARYTRYGIAGLLERNGFQVLDHTRMGSAIETLCQMAAAYVWHAVLPPPPAVKFLLTPVMVAPFSVAGLLLGAALPRDETLYQSHVVLCRKTGCPQAAT